MGLGVKQLFEELIATNYSKTPLERWIKNQEDNLEYKKEAFKEKCRYSAQEFRRNNFIYLVMIILLAAIILLVIQVFWL